MTRKFPAQSISYPTAATLETHQLYLREDRELGYMLSQHIFDDERGQSKHFDDGFAVIVKLRNRLGDERANAFYTELRENIQRSLNWMRAQPVKPD